MSCFPFPSISTISVPFNSMYWLEAGTMQYSQNVSPSTAIIGNMLEIIDTMKHTRISIAFLIVF